MSGRVSSGRSQSAAAVIVVPGIMGSELKEGDRTIWGFRSLRWYYNVWTENQFSGLRLTDAERDGAYGRVEPTALLQSPAFLPKFDKVNPYGELVKRLQGSAIHPDAVATFPYDWRLPVSHNGALLACLIRRHSKAWSQHPALRSHLAEHPERQMKVVVVAHSMGGLVAQHAAVEARVDRIIALGTPWHGSAKTISAMAVGDMGRLPFPRAAIRDLVTPMPSTYDLLPRWACVAPHVPTNDPTRVDEHVITSLLGDPQLFRDADAAYRARSVAATDDQAPEVVSMAGINQPTAGIVKFESGGGSAGGADAVVTDRVYLRTENGFERDRLGNLVTVDSTGDGTVPHFSASLRSHTLRSLQRLQHDQLAYAAEGLVVASHLVDDSEEPQFLAGASGLGIRIPQILEVGSSLEVELTGVDPPTRVLVEVLNADGRPVARPPVVKTSDGSLRAIMKVTDGGIFTVRAGDGHGTPLEKSFIVL